MTLTRTGKETGDSTSSTIDYDIHGLARLRLVDPSPKDVASVSAQIGPASAAPLTEAPNLTIRFVDDLKPQREVRWIEPHSIGFGDEGLFFYSGDKDGEPAGCLRPVGTEPHWELRCRSGLGRVPFLLPLVDLAISTNEAFALHASAFTYRGKGVLVAGWARSGKTTALLAFMARGAAYIGDDRVYLRADGSRVYGLPEPLSLRATHLAELPDLAQRIGRRERVRLRLGTALERTAGVAARFDSLGSFPRRVEDAASDASISISPAQLFGDCPLQGRLDEAFLAIAHDSSDVRVERLEPQHVAERLLFSIRAERLPLWQLYYAFRFAFPDQAEAFSEEAEEAETQRLAEALEGVETYALYHPFPAPVGAILDALRPIVG